MIKTETKISKPEKLSPDTVRKLYGIGEQIDQLIEHIESGQEPENNTLETGFPSLNCALGGGLSGLIVLGGTPGIGKTTMALQLGLDIAERNDVPFVFYSLEMDRERILKRIFSIFSYMSISELYGGRIVQGPEGKSKRTYGPPADGYFRDAKKKLQSLRDRVFIIDKTTVKGWSLEQGDIENHINWIKGAFEYKRVFVVVDHLQIFPLINYEEGTGTKRYQGKDERERLATLMDHFLRLQQETNSCVLLISQLNRTGYENPGLSSFMGSASIEYLADIGMALVNPEIIHEEESGRKLELLPDLTQLPQMGKEGKPIEREMYLCILKNRDGQYGKIPMKFMPEIMRFKEG